MPQYLSGSEAFVDAVLEREKSKKTLKFYINKDVPFILQQNFELYVYYISCFNSQLNVPHRPITIGQWRPKSFKPKYYETARELESK